MPDRNPGATAISESWAVVAGARYCPDVLQGIPDSRLEEAPIRSSGWMARAPACPARGASAIDGRGPSRHGTCIARGQSEALPPCAHRPAGCSILALPACFHYKSSASPALRMGASMTIRLVCGLLIAGALAATAAPTPSVAESNSPSASAPTDAARVANPHKHRYWRHRGGSHPHYGSRRVRTYAPSDRGR